MAKSVIGEGKQIQLAIELIVLGARLQVLEKETALSRERLLRLYKEVKGVSPPKGMLPFSTDWFMTWQPNIQASIFIGAHRFITRETDLQGIDAAIKAFRIYLGHVAAQDLEPVLSFTRAWMLLRYMESKLVQTTPCTRCGGHFVTHSYEINDDYVCGLCQPPSRAGKSRAGSIRQAKEAA